MRHVKNDRMVPERVMPAPVLLKKITGEYFRN